MVFAVNQRVNFSYVLLVAILVFGLTQTAVLKVSAQESGIIVIVGSDTTWTKADSPHNITGPLLISYGVTLTIEAGATVNLNGYYMLVNGSLRVLGSSSEPVYINNGDRIEFTDYSSDWDESGSGSLLEYATIHTQILLKNSSPKIHFCELNRIIMEGQSSPIISYNNLWSIF